MRLRMGAIGFDAVKHLVLCQVEKRPPKLDLDVYPYLPKANVGTTSAASYMSLMPGAGSMTEAPQILSGPPPQIPAAADRSAGIWQTGQPMRQQRDWTMSSSLPA